MSIFAVRLGFALVVAALCLGGRPAHAQSVPVRYWTPGWLGFGGNLNAGQGENTDGNFQGFGGSDTGGFSSTRYNFPNGWFVGNERGGMGLTGISQAGAFGSLSFRRRAVRVQLQEHSGYGLCRFPNAEIQFRPWQRFFALRLHVRHGARL